MQLFITDNKKIYDKSREKYKLLFDHKILFSSFIEVKEIRALNQNFKDIDQDSVKKTHEEIWAMVDLLKNKQLNVNKFVATRKKEDQIYSLLYANYLHFILRKHTLDVFLQILFSFFQSKSIRFKKMEFTLSDKNFFLKNLFTKEEYRNYPAIFNFYTADRRVRNLKNILYTFYHSYNYFSSRFKKPKHGARHILLVLNNIKHHYELLNTFFELVKADKNIFISIVNIRIGGFDKVKFIPSKQLISDNIIVYNFSEFRCPTFIIHSDLYKELEKIDPDFSILKKYNFLKSHEINYAWMNNVFQKLSPDVCLNIGTHTLGRIMSDVARYHEIPSTNLEYGIPLSGALLDNNIQFDTRICISEATKNIWIKRKDPSINHFVTGFCKMDELTSFIPDKINFFSRNNLDAKKRTILFASTWGSEIELANDEKKEIIDSLCNICIKNGWNLIIKKHPLELDNILDAVVNNKRSTSIRIFTHAQINIFEAIAYSDLVCNQMSSIILEDLYFEKPLCFISLFSKKFELDYPVYEESFAKVFFQMDLLEKYAIDIFNSTENYNAIIKEIKRKKEYYIYKSDGKASLRLKELLEKMC
jgi:hypothetical protein